jgi:dienelactone hydrolase
MPATFVAEWRAAFEAAGEVKGVDAGRAGYIGFSMGTLLGVPTVAGIPEIKAAVFGLGGVPRMGGVGDLAKKYGAPDAAVAMINAEDDAELRGQVVIDAARTLHDRQVLLLNMTEDEVFPIEGAFEFLKALPGPSRIAFFKGGHMEMPAEALDLAAWFLRRCLNGDAPDGRPSGAW